MPKSHLPVFLSILLILFVPLSLHAGDIQVSNKTSGAANALALSGPGGAADIIVGADDYAVVKLAAALFSDDVQRVTGRRPAVRQTVTPTKQIVLVGTLGHSALIDRLAKSGQLANIASLRGRWETTSYQIVEKPFPGVRRALVIVGSDRRGAAYGLMTLSERIGVSPWYWWADVPNAHQNVLTITTNSMEIQWPDVKYRGIFINDEDAGLNPWASQTYDPQFHNIGPKTYAKVFELMLRLKLNYLWPAMHPCSTEFGSVPENITLADKYGIIMGASHSEPMLRNNIWWPQDKGPWNYATNAANIDNYWEQSAKARGPYENVWTLGIRGIHDSRMLGPPDVPGKVALLQQVLAGQRAMLGRNVTREWGPVGQCFVAYKEVQPLYDAGLNIPPDVTLIWADDNYGYLRRLSSPAEQTRPGGSGFYYHLSYLGNPHAYTWINTTPPALMWEEMHKAWNNNARTLWMLNVGDIKPAEIGIDCYARLGWSEASGGPDMQPRFLNSFAQRTFGPQHAVAIAALLAEYYRLGQIRKPECMNQNWADTLTPGQATALTVSYQHVLDSEKTLSDLVPPAYHDAWTELVGYPARMLASTGLVFLEDRFARAGIGVSENTAAMARQRAFMESETDNYNNRLASGKWRNMITMGSFTGQYRGFETIPWPWLPATGTAKASLPLPGGVSRAIAASAFVRRTGGSNGSWDVVFGLGHSGTAMALEPIVSFDQNPNTEAALEYAFDTPTPGTEIEIDLLPTFRVSPGMKLRLSVRVDSGPAQVLEVPGSSGADDEQSPARRDAVLGNRVRMPVPMTTLAAGKHTLSIQAVDPGAVVDEITLTP